MNNAVDVYFEAAEMDDGAPVMYRFNRSSGLLRVAFDGDRPTEAAAALTTLFAHLQGRGILSGPAPRGEGVAAGR